MIDKDSERTLTIRWQDPQVFAEAAYTTLEVKVNFVRAWTMQTGRVRCEAKVIHAGARTATAEARLVDAAGKLYAHGTTTCMVIREPQRSTKQ
jgi:uncharacterized protein (TIGR00369 family)